MRPVAVFVLLAAGGPAAVLADCYWPDGNVTMLYEECSDPSDGGMQAGLCCRPGDVCLRSSICMALNYDDHSLGLSHDDGPDTPYYRGGCMEPDYGYGNCPQYCLDKSPSTELPVFQCASPQSSWYCHGDENDVDCKAGKNVFSVNGNTAPFNTVGLAVTVTSTLSSTGTITSTVKITATASSRTAPAASASSSPSSSAKPATNTTAGAGGSVVTNSAVLPPGLPSSAATPPPANASSPDQKQSNSAAVIPLAVGVAVGGVAVVAASVLGFLVLRKRRRDAPARAETPPPHDQRFSQFEFGFPSLVQPHAHHATSMSTVDHYRHQCGQLDDPAAVQPPAAAAHYPQQPCYQPPLQQQQQQQQQQPYHQPQQQPWAGNEESAQRFPKAGDTYIAELPG